MGGAVVSFTINRNGRSVEVTMNVPYSASDTGARANAHLEQGEIDIVRQAVQGVVGQGVQITGDTFTITENDGDLHNPPTARDIQRLPVALLMGNSPVGGGSVPPVAGGLGQPVPTAEVAIWPEDQNRGQWHGRICLRQPDGTWRLANATSSPGGAGAGPNPPPASPPPVAAADGGGATGPQPRHPAPGGGGGQAHHSPAASNGSIGANDF